jgi:DNA-binding transcriptional MerR regulator
MPFWGESLRVIRREDPKPHPSQPNRNSPHSKHLTLALQLCNTVAMEHSTPFAPDFPASLADCGEGSTPEAYGLEELLAAAGERLGEAISPRTVRLYATEGLIDRPGKEGRSAVYGHRHLLQLLLIRTLARRGLSLAAIAPLLGLEDKALELQLSQLAGDGATTSGVIDALTASTPEPNTKEANEALQYLQGLQPSTSDSPAGATEARAGKGTGLLSLLGSPLSSRSPSRSPPRTGGSRSTASRWHRFTLAPGVELQISESVSVPPPGSRRVAWLNRLVARLIEQLEDGPP